MFKRPHLRAAKRLVNAPFALSLLSLQARVAQAQSQWKPNLLIRP